VIDIADGRHPSRAAGGGGRIFVPNDVHLDGDREQILIVTAPTWRESRR